MKHSTIINLTVLIFIGIIGILILLFANKKQEKKIEEIPIMLGVVKLTENTLTNAREIIELANKKKNIIMKKVLLIKRIFPFGILIK